MLGRAVQRCRHGRAWVRTEITGMRDLPVEVEYRLLQRHGDWEVYDIVIEGVSLVNNYRIQLNNIIRQDSYAALVNKLKLKIEQEDAALAPKGNVATARTGRRK